MIDTEIHKGLEKSEIRDFLSGSLRDQYEDIYNVKKYTAIDKNGIDWSIANAEAEVKYHKKHLDILKNIRSLSVIIKMNGWRDHDVFDHVKKSDGKEYCAMFIGTDEEYNEFIKQFKDK